MKECDSNSRKWTRRGSSSSTSAYLEPSDDLVVLYSVAFTAFCLLFDIKQHVHGQQRRLVVETQFFAYQLYGQSSLFLGELKSSTIFSCDLVGTLKCILYRVRVRFGEVYSSWITVVPCVIQRPCQPKHGTVQVRSLWVEPRQRPDLRRQLPQPCAISQIQRLLSVFFFCGNCDSLQRCSGGAANTSCHHITQTGAPHASLPRPCARVTLPAASVARVVNSRSRCALPRHLALDTTLEARYAASLP